MALATVGNRCLRLCVRERDTERESLMVYVQCENFSVWDYAHTFRTGPVQDKVAPLWKVFPEHRYVCEKQSKHWPPPVSWDLDVPVRDKAWHVTNVWVLFLDTHSNKFDTVFLRNGTRGIKCTAFAIKRHLRVKSACVNSKSGLNLTSSGRLWLWFKCIHTGCTYYLKATHIPQMILYGIGNYLLICISLIVPW